MSKKKIFADISEDEKRVAVMESGKLIDLHISRVEDDKKVGNIYLGTVENIVEGINAAFVNIGIGKNAFLPVSDYPEKLEKGKKVTVQVSKEELQEKGAKITGKISIPGRNLVFMPYEGKLGVSRSIDNSSERKRLREILSSVTPKGSGFVARTSALLRDKKQILREAKYLIKIFNEIQRESKKARKNSTPAVLYEESDVALYAAREFLDDNTETFMINDKKVFKKVRSFVKKTFPELVGKLNFYQSEIPIFERYKIENQIDSLRKRTINLECGGYIIIEQTEALTAIDVNTGSYTSGGSREQTALKVNEEAAVAAASQIILRDIGGIVIIDFIDLKEKKNKQRLLDVMKQEMAPDKARYKIFPMTRLGIIQMTRQRRKESIVEKLCRDCPYCGGSGMIFSETTMYIKIKKEILKKVPSIPGKRVDLFMHPRVADEMERKGYAEMEKQLGKKINLRRDYKLHHEEYRIAGS